MKAEIKDPCGFTLELVYCFRKKPIMRLVGSFFRCVGYARGILIKRTQHGEVWYHEPSDYLEWKGCIKWLTGNEK